MHTGVLSLFKCSLAVGIMFCLGCPAAGNQKSYSTATPRYAGADACKSCHERAYEDWKLSDHFLAMQPANDSTILGDFNNVSFASDGVTSTFFKRDGKYYINTQGDDGLNHDFEILYTFGYYPLQQYLVAFPGGRLQATRASWNSRDKKWFHQYAGQTIAHTDWIHWTGNGQNWNTMCASCHSTDLQKNYDPASGHYATTWNEINVSCESCHGPGSNHIEFIQSKDYQRGERIRNAGLYYGRDTIAQLQVNTCAGCHARKTDVSDQWLRSDEIMDDLIPQVIGNEFYFGDGQIREEDYEYGSFTQSKMFAHNVRCSNCHNPHSGKLRLNGNALCLSCHKPQYDTPAHHFHEQGTEGGQCMNCHMTDRTYMGNDHRRDHSFRVPRPDQSIQYGTPNACISCHDEQTNAWAAAAVKKWYGTERKYHFSDDLLPGSLLDEKSESHLVRLLHDTIQPEIARATAAYYLGMLQTMGSAQALIHVLNDQKPLVRYHAIRSLESYPPELWQTKAYSALRDKVRSVRIAAADLYHRLPDGSIPQSYLEDYNAAAKENEYFLHYQTDFAVGNVMMADYQLQSNAIQEAIRYYERGLRLDDQMNYARINLATAYNLAGQNEKALQTLLDAAAIDPFNQQVYYNLGLLYHEMGNLEESLSSFKKAEQTGLQTPGFFYNYGLALQQQGKLQEAEALLLKGYGLHPQVININYALAFFYMQKNQKEQARKYGETLRLLDPENPDFRQLFHDLGL